MPKIFPEIFLWKAVFAGPTVHQEARYAPFEAPWRVRGLRVTVYPRRPVLKAFLLSSGWNYAVRRRDLNWQELDMKHRCIASGFSIASLGDRDMDAALAGVSREFVQPIHRHNRLPFQWSKQTAEHASRQIANNVSATPDSVRKNAAHKSQKMGRNGDE